MADPFVGEIRCVGFNFPPVGWAECDGQLIPISQNTALFSLLGTFYGGDGKSTFALPDLQGNVPLSQGQSNTGTQYFLGETSGTDSVTLLQSEMPLHKHGFLGGGLAAQSTPAPVNNIPTALGNGLQIYKTGSVAIVPMAPNMAGIVGASQPHNNMMPFLTLNFVIAMQGIFPQRS
jgi:microcystin-dependent protein